MMRNSRTTPPRLRSVETEPLWAVTSYFNPAGYNRRLGNYHAFRRNLQTPLLVIELAAEGRHQLREDDADKVIRLTGEDRIWQKERLINLAIDALPDNTEFIAWIDCDLVFDNPHWARDAQARLSNGHTVVQLFENVAHLPREFDPLLASRLRCRACRPLFQEESFAHCLGAGTYFSVRRPNRADVEATKIAYAAPPVAHGHAWAARRELVAEHGLYDACIIGGGDKAFAMAVSGHAGAFVRSRPMAEGHAEHYVEWAQRISARTREKVGAVPGHVYHLWHGSYQQRHYEERHVLLKRLEFDPRRHLESHHDGTWRWNATADNLRRSVSEYFFSRHEDGESAAE